MMWVLTARWPTWQPSKAARAGRAFGKRRHDRLNSPYDAIMCDMSKKKNDDLAGLAA